MSAGRRRFRIIKEIAEGGFGKVYLAEQISSDGFSRIVAVKLLHAKWSSHDEVVMRTRDEARLLGLIRHQHIVKVEDLTAIDSKCAIVMEYLEGCDLKWMISFLQERNLDFPRAALFEIVLAVASALDAAYNGVPLQGGQPLRVIHRDIKPSNIFVTVAGGVKVLDFGTARANFAEREAKTQALAFGSQGYMAPERMLGEEDTPAADVFSLGIALYEILSLESFGRIPPRPNKFASKVEERVRSLPLSGDPEWCDQVRDTLRLMLSYEASERPTAAQLVEIMELLASDANDMGLRRFCRTLVAEAKANLPDLDTGDPLTGRIVEEDSSASFPDKAVGNTFVDDDDLAAPPTERMLASDIARLTGDSGLSRSTGSTPTTHMDSRGNVRPPRSSALSAPIEPDVGGKSNVLLAGLGGATLLVIAIFLVFVLLLIFALVGAMYYQPAIDTGGIVVEQPEPVNPVPVPTPQPDPDPLQPGPAPGPETPGPETPGPETPGPETPGPETPGPVPEAPDPASNDLPYTVKTASAGGVAVTLDYSTPAGGEVVLKGTDFDIVWMGKGPIELDLAPGRVRTKVADASGKTIRGKSFSIEGEKCSFTFEVENEDWSGSCE